MKITSVKVSQNTCLGFLSVLCTACVLQPSFFHICQTVFGDTSMLNLTKSVCVNTRAESSSFACSFSSMALKVLGKLVYLFLSLGNHTVYWSLCIKDLSYMFVFSHKCDSFNAFHKMQMSVPNLVNEVSETWFF